MIESSPEQLGENDNPRMDTLQNLLFAVSMTILLLIPAEFRTFVSVEAAVVAIVGGVVAGVGIALAGFRLDLGDVDDLHAIVGVLTAIAASLVLAWFFLPRGHTATVAQFTVAFLFTEALIDVTRQLTAAAA